MKRPVFYLSTDAVAFHPDRKEIIWRNSTGSPVPVRKTYGVVGGFVVLDLPDGRVGAVETGKGHIIGTYWVDGN